MADAKSIAKGLGKTAVTSGNLSTVAYSAESAAKGALRNKKVAGQARKIGALMNRLRGGKNAIASMAQSRIKSIVGRNIPHQGRELLALKRKLLGTALGVGAVGMVGKAIAGQKGKLDKLSGGADAQTDQPEIPEEIGPHSEAELEAKDAAAAQEAGDPSAIDQLEGKASKKADGMMAGLKGQFAGFGFGSAGAAAEEEVAEEEIVEEEVPEEPDPEIDESITVLRSTREDGSLKAAIEQENGKLSGASEEYDEFGNVTMQAFYLDGKLQGPMTHYDAEGNVTQLIEFDEGHAEGKCTQYDEQGRRIQEASFKNGMLDGECLFYREGRLVMKMRYAFGKAMGPGTIYNDQENVMMEANYVDGKLNGPAKFYDKAGQLTRECSYLDNKLHGQLTDYYPNGNPMTVAQYALGKQTGKAIEYHESGEVRREETFVNDLKEGESIGYYPDGTIMDKAVYREGRRKGDLVRFDQNGNQLGKDGSASGGFFSSMKKKLLG